MFSEFQWHFLKNNQPIYWKGFSNKDRNAVIYEIEQQIGKFGFIIDFQMFSDMEISIRIEIETGKAPMLFDELSKIITIQDENEQKCEFNHECLIYLNITFSSGTGNLRIETPAVPG